MSADPRPPLRWVPILLGLLVASLLIVIQLTRAEAPDEATTTASGSEAQR